MISVLNAPGGQGGGPCGPINPKTPSVEKETLVKNRVAASLADARFRPQRTQDKTKKHPRQLKYKDQDCDE